MHAYKDKDKMCLALCPNLWIRHQFDSFKRLDMGTKYGIATMAMATSTWTKTLRDPVHVEILRDIVILLTPDLS